MTALWGSGRGERDARCGECEGLQNALAVPVQALDQVSLTVAAGDLVAVTGP